MNTPQKQGTNKHRFILRLICLFRGHQKAVPMLHETDSAIWTKGCPRCGSPLGFPAAWKNGSPPPNCSTEEKLQEWEQFKLEHHANIRASVKGLNVDVMKKLGI